MKKLLIILTILFSVFLFTDKVSAMTFLNEYDRDVHINNTYEMTDSEIRKFYNEIENSNNYNYLNVYYTIEDYINARNKLKSMFYGTNTKYILYDWAGQLYYKTITTDINPGIALFKNSDNGFEIYFGFNSENIGSQYVYKYKSDTNTFSQSGKSREFGSQISIYDMTTLTYDIVDLFETNYHSENMQYYLPVYGDDKYSEDITYNNETYSINSYLPIDVYDGLNPISIGPQIEVSEVDSSYVNISSPIEGQSFKTSATYNISFTDYDESIYDYYYSSDNTNWINIYNDYQLKVVENGTYYFKITDKENNLVNSTSLGISTLKALDYVKVKLDVNDLIENNGSIDFQAILNNDDNLKAKPYIETFYNDNGKYIERRNQWNKEDEKFNFYLTQDLNTTVYYNYVLDLIDYYENIDLTFTSNNSVGFEIVYYLNNGQVLTTGLEEYTSTYPENYNLVKLDLSSSSGIMIMPKNYSTNDVFSNFYNGDIQHVGLFGIYLNGNFRIRNYTKNGYLRLTSDSNDKNFYYGNAEITIENGISYPFPTDSGYLIIKQESNMGSRGDSSTDYIILDTERYVYKIMVSDSENPTINNPDNENITITGPSINDSDLEDKILNSSTSKDYEDNVGSVTEFIDTISDTLNYVREVLELGFSSLPSFIQGFLIFIFNILCIFMILRMGGYLG